MGQSEQQASLSYLTLRDAGTMVHMPQLLQQVAPLFFYSVTHLLTLLPFPLNPPPSGFAQNTPLPLQSTSSSTHPSLIFPNSRSSPQGVRSGNLGDSSPFLSSCAPDPYMPQTVCESHSVTEALNICLDLRYNWAFYGNTGSGPCLFPQPGLSSGMHCFSVLISTRSRQRNEYLFPFIEKLEMRMVLALI